LILDSLHADDLVDVLRAISVKLSERIGVCASTIEAALLERAQKDPVGVGDGVAIPHARIPELSGAVGAFARLLSPVDFGAHDERACDLVFVLLTPQHTDSDHLKALAHIARAFHNAELRTALRSGEDNAAALLLNEQRSAA